MDARHYRAMIERAAKNADTAMLDNLAQFLMECEEANGILRYKGYSKPGMTILQAAKAVPVAFGAV